ncbi:type VII secretion integral membrane protein EccD [Mycobacterium sp. NPDC006124]|uniref:type VII secretion integral membrane protein EccD n=1 Tax=Mycobacterium sp. NPDC006124 TaxID=3156729 RepID=UPI0033B92F68
MSVSKVCVQTDRDGDPLAVDLVLPSRTTVAELLPTIVDLVGVGATADGAARDWRLQRVTGEQLDESTSLEDNDVCDGELLILDAGTTPALGPIRHAAPWQVVASPPAGGLLGVRLSNVAAVLATVLAAVVLASTAGSDDAVVAAMVAAASAAAAAVAAFVTGYSTTSSVGVIALVGATGFVVVPSGPAAPNVFLAAAAAASASLMLLRLSGRPSAPVIAAASVSGLVAAATVVALPTHVLGAALATSAIVLLALAPRLSMLTAGLGPGQSQGDLTTRVAAGHVTLSGLVAGSSGTAAAGAVVVAVSGHSGAAPFAGLVGAALLLRIRTHADADRRTCLAAGGFIAVCAGLWTLVDTRPETVGPVAGVLVVAGLVTAHRPRVGPMVARALDRVEYCALVAVIPAACWVGGAFVALEGLVP